MVLGHPVKSSGLFVPKYVAGIGCGIALWLVTNSTWGEKVLGNWNLFSYAFRNVMDSQDFGWLYGKVLCLLLCVLMTLLMPKIIKKRG